MGLLSDPEAGGGLWAARVVRFQGSLGAAAWVAALAWLLSLALPTFNNATYFSENALLPGLVRGDWNDDRLARRLHTELLEELQDKYEERDGIPVPWLIGKMSQLRLETYTHNFTLHHPFDPTQVFTGTNVYGIVRAARTPALEALVVSVPYRSVSSHLPHTAAGLALALAYAHLARSQSYWAKDLVVVVTEHEQLGMQAWLEAYHGSLAREQGWAASLGALAHTHGPAREVGPLQAGELHARSGVIQAAINLEIAEPEIKYVEVLVEGVNGQLANLDLVNLVHRMCDKAHVPHAYRSSRSWRPPSPHTALRTLLGQLSAQATGAPAANHGLFHKYGIEAVTLAGRTGSDSADAARLPPTTLRALGRVLDGTLRSLNNLLERFHQSYFFYILSDTDRFASIGQYMPALCLPVAALLLRALALWLEPALAADPGSTSATTTTQNPIPGRLLVEYVALHAWGAILALAPPYFTVIGRKYGWRTEQSVYWGAAAACALATLAFGPGARRSALLAPALLELGALLVGAGLHNPAFALLVAAVYTPSALLVAKGGSLCRALSRSLLALTHPLLLLTLCVCAYAALVFPEESAWAKVARGVSAAQDALVYSAVDQAVYGIWVWNFVCAGLVPVWGVLWRVS